MLGRESQCSARRRRPGATGDDSGTGLEGEGQIPIAGADKGTNAGGTLNVLSIDDDQIDDIIEFPKTLTSASPTRGDLCTPGMQARIGGPPAP